jgi:hypothetical protein
MTCLVIDTPARGTKYIPPLPQDVFPYEEGKDLASKAQPFAQNVNLSELSKF